MDGVNKVMLLGTLGMDPELKATHGGAYILAMRVATNESFKNRNGEWEKRTEWHTVTTFGKRAESLSRLLSKGSRVFVEGSLRTSGWEGQDGQKRYKTEVIAREVYLCGDKPRGGTQESDQSEPAAPRDTDDIPF